VHVGDFPAAIFETVDRDGKTHAHRIYLAPGGAGKAQLGLGANGQRRQSKKAARKTADESTAGRAVIWGDTSKAELELIFEGCMSSEHFGQLAWQFKRVSGSSGLKVQAAIAC
jgi:hypothetical protein